MFSRFQTSLSSIKTITQLAFQVSYFEWHCSKTTIGIEFVNELIWWFYWEEEPVRQFIQIFCKSIHSVQEQLQFPENKVWNSSLVPKAREGWKSTRGDEKPEHFLLEENKYGGGVAAQHTFSIHRNSSRQLHVKLTWVVSELQACFLERSLQETT